MSNHPHSSGLETPSDTADDLDEPPPPIHQKFVIHGFPDQGGHGVSTLNRWPHRRPLTHRRRIIDKQEEGDHIGLGAFPFPGSSTSTWASQGQAGQSIVAPTQVHPGLSHPHFHQDPSYAHIQPRYKKRHHQQQNQGDVYHSEHGQQDTVVYYDPQHYYQQQPRAQLQQSEGHYQQSISHTSPDNSGQPANIAFSSPDSTSLLRHPHDPRLLLQPQFQAVAQGGFEFHQRDPGFPQTSPGDLVPIRFQGLDPSHVPQQPPADFALSFGHPAAPAQLFHHHNSDHGLLRHHHSYTGVLQFPGGYPISFMQNPELSILNAESYDDGMSGFRAPRSLPSGRPRRATGDEPLRPKKRTKAQSSEAGELEEEDKKRSRGRPRLDTNDETAKDRRRTQIRLAQRAYRNRKETAIQSLEKKVDELRKTNEEMSKEFMRLYDFAVSKGMHESTPEFGLQLQATTEKFVALARRTNEELEKDGELPVSQDNDGDAQEASPTTGHAKHSDTSSSPDAAAAKPAEAMYGGFIVSHEETTTVQSTPRSQALTAVHTTSWATGNQSQAPHSTVAQAPLGYEIVTEPTTDNASFPFGMSFEDSLDQAGSLNLSDQSFSETLFSIFSAPSSYAYQERTFGRRLQRSTLEKAYLLVCMPDPPPALMSSTFGFCLLFEPKERIKERVANCLRVNERESMFNWKFPFLNLGGGGTWFEDMNEMDDAMDYPRGGKPRGLVGNQGTAEPHRQKVDSVFGLGPWDAGTEETRDLRIDHEAAKLHMSVPGFEGDFYDADEVEWVLRQRGVVIPPAADFVTAEVDPADFSTDTTAGGLAFGTGAQSSVDDMIGGLRSAEKSSISQFTREHLGMNLKPTRASDINLDDSQSTGRVGEAAHAPKNIDPSLGGDTFGLGEESINEASNAGSRKRLVTINVGVLVQEIGLKSVCLGRSPGVRPKDLNIAFWASLAV